MGILRMSRGRDIPDVTYLNPAAWRLREVRTSPDTRSVRPSDTVEDDRGEADESLKDHGLGHGCGADYA